MKKISFAVLLLFALTKILPAVLPFPKLNKFLERPYSTRIYDSKGRLIHIVSLENGLRREFLPLKEFPSSVRSQFIGAEDKRFFLHSGIDFFSAARAFFQNKSNDRRISGASTISMQLARIISPSSSRNYFAKAKDCVNAVRLESKLSKNQILELYLNNLPFGNNCEGVASAAKQYFGKELEDLNEMEIFSLSKIPRNPAIYKPENKTGNFQYPQFFPHYIEYLKKNFSSVLRKNYEVQLFCDLECQLYGENLLKQSLKNTEDARIYNGAILVTDKNNSVIAWIGSQNWSDSDHSGQIDGITNRIQPGSSMKPFLYALAMDAVAFSDSEGKPILNPSDVLADIPMEFGERNMYIPQNFNNCYNGPVRTRVALASSLNIPAVNLLNRIGIQNYLELLVKCGFKNLEKDGTDYGLGLALGAGEVSLKELVSGFSVFCRDGLFEPEKHFKYLSSTKIKQYKSIRIFSKDISRIICAFLSDKKSRSLGFGYTQSFQTDYPAIFKTGTSNQFQNITALGATNDFTVGVWMGNFNGNTVIGKTGSSLPAFQAKKILDYLEKNCNATTESLQFKAPESFHLEKVCSVSGMAPSIFCPETVYEFVKNGTENSVCSWHVENSEKRGAVQLLYPPEYQKWLFSTETAGRLDYKAGPLKIENPKNGSLYYYDSGKSRILQIVPVEVTGGQENELEVFLDGNPVCTKSRPFSFSLEPVQGKHKLSVICGKEMESVEYIVK